MAASGQRVGRRGRLVAQTLLTARCRGGDHQAGCLAWPFGWTGRSGEVAFTGEKGERSVWARYTGSTSPLSKTRFQVTPVETPDPDSPRRRHSMHSVA